MRYYEPFEPKGPVEWFLFIIAAVCGLAATAAVGMVAAVILGAMLGDLLFG